MSFAARLCGNFAIAAWMNGQISSAELHEELTDSEYLRYLSCDYYEELIDRYESLYETQRPVVTSYWMQNGIVLSETQTGEYCVYPRECFCDSCIIYNCEMSPTVAPRPKAEQYTLSSPEGCELEWDHGGFSL